MTVCEDRWGDVDGDATLAREAERYCQVRSLKNPSWTSK